MASNGDYANVTLEWDEETDYEYVEPTAANTHEGGGIRIKSTTLKPNTAGQESITTDYEYSGGKLLANLRFTSISKRGYGRPDTETIGQEGDCTGYGEYALMLIRSSSNMLEQGLAQGSHVGYNTVTIKKAASGRVVKTFINKESRQFQREALDISGNSIGTGALLPVPALHYDHINGSVKQDSIYGRNIVGEEVLLRNTVNHYSDVVFDEGMVGFQVGYAKTSKSSGECDFCTLVEFEYSYYDNPIAYPALLESQDIYTYEEGATQPITKTIYYEYDQNFLPRKVYERPLFAGSNTNHINTEPFVEQETIYPSSSSSAIATTMLNRNMLAVPLEKRVWKVFFESTSGLGTVTKKLISSGKADYQNWTGNILPQKLSTKYLAEPLTQASSIPSASQVAANDAVSVFEQYDSFGNPRQYRKIDGRPAAMLWDSQGLRMLAQAQNSEYADLAYSSFETYGGVGWSSSNANHSTSNVFAGNRSATGTFTKSNLDPEKEYIVSCWAKSTAPKVNGISMGSALEVANGWRYYEYKVSGVSSCQVITQSATDELRLFPEQAMMQTFVYDERDRVEAQSDPNGITVFYFYDHASRVRQIVDQYGKPVKSAEYKYQD